MRVVPLTLKQAAQFVRTHHRHNKAPQGHRFSIGLEWMEPITELFELCGVVVVGRPVARKIDQHVVAEVTRLCVASWAPRNACSMLYRAAWRTWKEMGGDRLITYTLQSESGASLRGAGFVIEKTLAGQKPERWQSRKGREYQSVVSEPKIRWSVSRGLM